MPLQPLPLWGGCTVAGALTANGGTVYGAHTLYDNSSGTTGTITLSSSLANYAYVDIMNAKLDGDSGGYNVCRVYSPSGKRASFNQINYVRSANTIQTVFSKILMSGTSITWDVPGAIFGITTTSGAVGGISAGEGAQLIYKIVGYK